MKGGIFMGELSKNEQTEVVKKALELEKSIINYKKELSKVNKEKFKSAPTAPIQKKAKADYSSLPQVDLKFQDYLMNDVQNNPTTMNKLFGIHPFIRALIAGSVIFVVSIIILMIPNVLFMMFGLLLMLAAIVPFVIALVYFSQKRTGYNNLVKEMKERLPQTPAYINAKMQADMIAQQQQEEFDRQYASEKYQYDTVTIPQYNSELEAWTNEHNKKIQDTTINLNNAETELNNLYTSTMIIPMQYRTIEALEYFYQLMSTSDYDIREAVDMYDKEVQRQLEMARIAELQRSNALADEQNYHLYQQNSLLNEQNELQYQYNETAEKHRKDDLRRELETEYHRHQVRKHLNNK